ncbi:DNA polymerase-like protein [Tanacetum coccineum]
MKQELRVSCYTDAGYLTDADDIKSQTGYVFILNGDAEYITAFDASKEAVWIRKFIFGLDVVPTIEEPINMYYDNTGAIAIAKDHEVTKGKAMLFRFRDSLNLLPSTLQNLAMSLCPDLGTKGSVDHESVNEKSLEKDNEVLIEYMKKDILLLGGVMQKAQNIYWKLYQLDIESKITLSSLALNIFRLRYYNDEIFPIHIPNQNEDTFIKKAYYEGHTNSYKPYDSN